MNGRPEDHMKVTREEVRKVARLARLRLDEDEVSGFTRQLCSILDHVSVIDEVDVDESQPAREAADMGAPFRSPSSAPDELQSPVAEMAPEWSDPFFTVPLLPVLESKDAEIRPDGTEVSSHVSRVDTGEVENT